MTNSPEELCHTPQAESKLATLGGLRGYASELYTFLSAQVDDIRSVVSVSSSPLDALERKRVGWAFTLSLSWKVKAVLFAVEEVRVEGVDREDHAKSACIGVVLFQLGGPDSLEAVEPFLYNLFSDPDIIDFPFSRVARPALARLISARRARKGREHYAQIGGKSPIRALTELQAATLERELQKTLPARVFVAMRYWHPTTEEVARRIESLPLREILLLPLYPQYSKTTTGSSLNEWHRKYNPPDGKRVPVKIIREYHTHPTYLDAVVEKINEGLERFQKPAGPPSEGPESPAPISDVHLVFSAHGVPQSVIEAGDPYLSQIETTVKLVTKRGGWPNPHRACYQSRVGPGRWVGPSLNHTLADLGACGVQKVLVIPISFVCDHVETLNEIDIEARGLAINAGVRRFEVMPALNDSPKFIRALAELVLREAQ